jgi:hypothetical protein
MRKLYGFSILELLIAFTIMSSSIISLTALISTLREAVVSSALEKGAFSIATEEINQEYKNDSQNFLSVTSLSTTTNGIYKQSLTVQLNSDGVTKDLTSIVQWKDDWNNSHSIQVSATVSDLSEQPDTAECTFDIKNALPPTDTELLFKDLLPPSLSTTTHPISFVTISNSTFFAISSSTVNKTDPDLFIFALATSTLPSYMGSLDTSPTTKQGISAVAAAGSYIYVANSVKSNFATCKTSSSCAQLQVIDIHSESEPVVLDNYQLATTSLPYATGSGGQASAKSVAYASGRVYLGLTKSGSAQGDEFNIIDVTTPTSPQWLGGYSIGRSVNKIRIKGAYAYIATDGPQEEVLVLNISDPTHISLVYSFNAPGSSLYGYGKDLDFASTSVVLGRSYAQGSQDLFTLSANPQGSFSTINSEIAATSSNPISVISLLTHNESVYVLTSADLEFWRNISNGTPTEVNSETLLSSSSTATSLACNGNNLYMSSVDGSDESHLDILSLP